MRKSDFFDISYQHGGLFMSEASWIHSTRSIHTYEIILVTKGTVYIREEDVHYEVQAGDYLILYPERVHGGTRMSELPVEFYWLHFTDPMGAWQTVLPQHGTLRNVGTIMQSAQQILHYQEMPTYPSSGCDFALCVLLCEMIAQSAPITAQNVLAERVHEYIRSHTETVLQASDVAGHFGYNADYVSRVMKTYYGKTLQQQIVDVRLQQAKYLLQTSEYTVDRVARELGYEDANLFVKFFRYHTRMAPTAYRNRYHKRFTNHL